MAVNDEGIIVFSKSDYSNLIYDIIKAYKGIVNSNILENINKSIIVHTNNYVCFLLTLDSDLKEYAEQENIEIDTSKIHFCLLSLTDNKFNIASLREFAAGDFSRDYPLMYYIIDSLLNDREEWQKIADAVDHIH